MILSKVISLKQVYHCVQLELNGECCTYRSLQVRVHGSDLDIIMAAEVDSLMALKQELGTAKPVLLLLSGTKIIDKKLNRSPNYLREVLYNNSLDDFYLNEREIEGEMLISVARKSVVDPLLLEFKEAGFELIEFKLGRWYLSLVSELIDNDTPIMGYDPIESCLQEYQTTDNVIAIGDQRFKESHSLAMALAISKLQAGLWTTNYQEFTQELQTDFKYKKWFKRLGAGLLVFLLISLSASYFLNAHYNSKNLSIQAAVVTHQQLQKQVSQLEKDKAFKEQILEELQLGRKAYLSDYLWQIGASVPAEVQLESLVVFPLQSKVKPQEFIEINSRLVEISGEVSNTQSFATWTEVLRSKPWITAVEVTDYQRQQSGNLFKIILHL